MSEATVVGSTRVSLIPDMSQFGDRLRIELPSAIREPAKSAGDLAGDAIRNAISKKLAKPIGVKVRAALDDKAATTALRKLTEDRTVKITAELDDKAAVAALTKLTADRKVKITAEIDDTAAKTKLAGLSGQTTVDVLPQIQQAALRQAQKQLDKLTADRVVNIRANVDTRVGANEIQNLIRRRVVRLGVDVDTRVAADDLANLTRRRYMTVQARADVTAATNSLRFLTRDRSVNVRVRPTGLGALTAGLNSLGGSSGGGAGGVGLLSSRIVVLAGAVITALPSIASLGSAIAQMGPLAATAAPAVTLLATAFATVKVGTTGIGDAIKAAFQPATAEATKAATATKQVETAQRQFATAQRGVTDAERSLTEAQRAARLAQVDLNDARRQAARDLADMNAQLKQGRLDEKQAALDVEQAELDLAKVRSDPTSTQLQIQQADLALERARANAEEQSRQQKRLAADTKAANKAGAEGSDVVVQAKERIRQANLQVEQQERSLADAHRAVTDAARQVAEAQQAAATQTSKLDTALAKLSPNARAFIGQLQEMAPAWRAMRLDVQDALFAGIARRLGMVGAQVLPTVRTGLTGAAGELNTMGMNALTAVSNLEKTGQLKKVFDGVRDSLHNITRLPGQLVTGLAQLSIAAQPAFDRITAGAGSAVDRVMAKLAKGLQDGSLTDAINTALDVAVKFGHVLGDIGGIFKSIFSAAADAGGDFFGVIGAALAEIRRVLEMPEMQSALRAIFTALNAVAKLLAGALGQALQALMPILAVLAPFVTQIAQMLAPVIKDVVEALGKALMPIAAALGPVLVVAAKALVALVEALAPLLPPIGELIAALLPALTPLLDALVQVFVGLAPVIKQVADMIGPVLLPIIKGLADVLAPIAQQFAKQFLEILQQLIPVIPILVPVVMQLAKSIGQILSAVAPLIPQLMLLGVQFITMLLPALLPLVPPMTQLSLLLTRIATWVILKVVIPALKGLVWFLQGLRKAFQPAVDAVKWLTEKIAKFFQWLYDFLLGHSIIPDIVNGAIHWFSDMWKRVTKFFTNLRSDAARIWNDLWKRISGTATSAYKSLQSGLSKFGVTFANTIGDIRDSVGKIWSGLQKLFARPIRFWIETVFNKGVVGVWNATASKIPGVPDMKKMAVPKGFSRGGILPGSSSWRDGDDQLVPMRRGEGVYVSEVMRDPYERARLHAMNQAAMRGQNPAIARGQYGFAGGGIIGDIGSGLSSIGSGIADGVGKVLGKGADVVRGGLAGLAEKAFKPVKSGIGKALGNNANTWPGMVARGPLHLIDRAIEYIRGKDVPDSTGQWIKPVNVPYGTRFGVKGRMWSSGRHTGLDFPARVGTKVVAVDNGTVKSAESGGPYGKHVMINHGGGLQSLYAHMSAIAARVGAGIKQGGRVGSVGATGNVTGPHLHLEARVNGRSVDPMPYLTGGGDGGTGVQRWKGVVTQALGQVHQSLSLVNTTLRRMNQESGGNPKAVNMWDINARLGHPSVGLMQVIKGTFQRYAGKYKKTGPFMYGVSTDPMANIFASMKYALANYGSLSKAYNRPGGYARGGVIGGGVRIGRGLARGYATGGVIRVGGKRIDTGPIAASVGSGFLKQLAGTASAISAAMNKVATAVKNAFKGVKTDLDNKLLSKISTANKQLQALSKQRDAIAAKITAANALASEASGQASQFAQLTSLPNGGNTFDAGGILGGLNTRLAQIKDFGKNLKILGQRGLSKALLQQIISAGPDGGASYAKALVDATPQQLKDINAAQAQITTVSAQYGKDAADAMYDAGSQSGKGYLAGLKAQEAQIVKAMAGLAKKIQKTLKVELKISSPSRITRALGRFTGLGFAYGVRDTAPRVAAEASRMAALVRTSAAATTARIESSTSTASYGDRVLNYNATVREQASRASVLAALAMEDMLHRPVLAGG